jgi:hypothetical protein
LFLWRQHWWQLQLRRQQERKIVRRLRLLQRQIEIIRRRGYLLVLFGAPRPQAQPI